MAKEKDKGVEVSEFIFDFEKIKNPEEIKEELRSLEEKSRVAYKRLMAKIKALAEARGITIPASSQERYKASLNGVNFESVIKFLDRFGLTRRELASLLGINDRTLYTQLKEGKLDEKNSDRFLLIESVFEEGVDALMSEKAFIEWLHTPHSHFDKETPFSLLTTINGAEAVREELIRTKYGVLS